MKINKIARVSLYGGLLGAMFTNPRAALDRAVATANQEGWNCIQITPHRTTNLFIALIQILVLCLTLGLWTFGAGYLLLLERDIGER